MRILHVISDLLVSSGGVASVVNGLSQSQAVAGMHVTIACLAIANRGPQYTPVGVTVVTFPRRKGGQLASSPELRQWLSEHSREFDIIHIHGIWMSPNHNAAVAARCLNVPYLIAPHGMLDRWSIQKSKLLKRLYWWLLQRKDFKNAAAAHLLNQAEKERSPWLAGIPSVIVGNGISASELASIPCRGAYRESLQNIGITRYTPICLFLSRLHPKKGLHALLPLWKKGVLSYIPDAHLIIAGTGDSDYVSQLEDIVAKENLGDRVHFVGQLAGAAKWQALVDADLFVLPSSQEGFSMAITEAMAAKCPVIITEDCNFREVAEVGAGLTVATGNMSQFCQAVTELLGDASRRKQMGEAGQALVRERYVWEKIAKDFEQIYSDIIARHKKR